MDFFLLKKYDFVSIQTNVTQHQNFQRKTSKTFIKFDEKKIAYKKKIETHVKSFNLKWQ